MSSRSSAKIKWDQVAVFARKKGFSQEIGEEGAVGSETT
jgi:hypothetical protein